MTTFYKASRWDYILMLITLLVCIGSVGLMFIDPDPTFIISLVIIISLTFFHTVLGYILAGQKLVIHRIGRNYKIDLADLEDVEFKDQMVSNSWKLIGKGGLFAWLGATKSKAGKTTEFYVTNKNKCVILHLENRQMFIYPSEAKEFVSFIQQHVVM